MQDSFWACASTKKSKICLATRECTLLCFPLRAGWLFLPMRRGLSAETFFFVVRHVKMPRESENCDPPSERIGELRTGVRAGTRQQEGD